MRIIRMRGKAPEEDGKIAVNLETLKSVEEAELAMHLTEDAFRAGKNIAKKKKLEFLLWLSGTRDIKNALKKTRPKEDFFLISFNENGDGGHGLPERGEPLRLEKISLSRI